MKIKVIILIISVLLGDVAMGQSTVKPNTFPLEPSPSSTLIINMITFIFILFFVVKSLIIDNL